MDKNKNIHILEKIEKLLSQIKIFINNDGGDVNFVSFDNGILVLKISGACVGCMMIHQTYDEGIRYTIINQIPEVKEVKFITK